MRAAVAAIANDSQQAKPSVCRLTYCLLHVDISAELCNTMYILKRMTCDSSNNRCAVQLLTRMTGVKTTQRLCILRHAMCAVYICTRISLLPLTTTALKFMMVVGNQTQQSHDSMHSSMGYVMAQCVVYFRRTMSGSFMITSTQSSSSTVTPLHA